MLEKLEIKIVLTNKSNNCIYINNYERMLNKLKILFSYLNNYNITNLELNLRGSKLAVFKKDKL